MRRTLIALSTTALVVTPLVALAAPAEASGHERVTFVVDTQFVNAPSDMTGTGPLESCTQVLDLGGGGVPTGPNTVLFFGAKELQCAGGTVTIEYEATMNFRKGRRTSGTWWVVESTLPGVTGGGGQLKGDNERCTLEAGSEGCILDTFTGFVHG